MRACCSSIEALVAIGTVESPPLLESTRRTFGSAGATLPSVTESRPAAKVVAATVTAERGTGPRSARSRSGAPRPVRECGELGKREGARQVLHSTIVLD